MSVKIQDISPGDEIQLWMKLGLAIHPTVTAKGVPYYKVPNKPQTAGSGDLTRFIGWVVRNDPDQQTVTVQVSAYNSWCSTIPDPVPKTVTVSYTALKRARRFSKFAHSPKTQLIAHVGGKGLKRPGSVYHGTQPRAYRTLEEILL
jgi:hypothetical protein